MNDLARFGEVRAATLATYRAWLRGDVLKRGKREAYLRGVLAAIVNRYGSRVSWSALARELSIDHPGTVADHVELLASMDAVLVQPALLGDKLSATPKKPKKVVFADPLIFQAVRHWPNPTGAPLRDRIRPAANDPIWAGRLAEACAVTHLRRHFPTYCIKAEGEVDACATRCFGKAPCDVPHLVRAAERGLGTPDLSREGDTGKSASGLDGSSSWHRQLSAIYTCMSA